jgi:hypothetical protein
LHHPIRLYQGGLVQPLSKIAVVASFLITFALLAFSAALVWPVDSSLGMFVGAGMAVLIMSAILLGFTEPGEKFDASWKRMMTGWVDFACQSPRRVITHIILMVFLFLLGYRAGLGSYHANVLCPDSFSQYTLTWRNWLGKDVEARCRYRYMTPIWLPFASEDNIRIAVTDNNQKYFECTIQHERLFCPQALLSSPPADYAIGAASDFVDFTRWKPYSAAEDKPSSFVEREFGLDVNRLKPDAKKFERWAATSGKFGMDCIILSGNASCFEVPGGTFPEPDRRIYQIEINPDAFPPNQPTPLKYKVTYKNSYNFTTDPANANICTGCDVTFVTRYPIEKYDFVMKFPPEWGWEKILIVRINDRDSEARQFEEKRNPEHAAEFHYTLEHLSPDSRVTFNIFPDSRIPRK